MIDDQFPTYANLLDTSEGAPKYKEQDRALALYQGFKTRHMVCDVENKIGGVPPDTLRKSDLVVLDYNLGPTDHANDRAINILRELAASKHFNSIVVYTAEPDQDKVWLEIAASLTGGWNDAGLNDEAQEHWDRLSDAGLLPEPLREALLPVVTADMRSLPNEERARLRQELADLQVPGAHHGAFLKALIHREIAKFAGPHANADRQTTVGRCRADGSRWVQCRNCFIAVLKKGDINAAREDDPAGIMDCLSKALLDWRPNLFQIVISEIQNILELEALVTEDEHLRDPSIHAGLWYYLLESLGQSEISAAELTHAPLSGVVDRIVDGLRRRLSSDPALLELAGGALMDELEESALQAERPARATAEFFKAAQLLARPHPAGLDHADVMFKLNNFLSTERARRINPTTGTIFRELGSDTYWVAASPACDLAARKPGKFQKWAHQLHPTVALTALHLAKAEINTALKKAEQGQYVFLDIDGQKKAFSVVDAGTSQPVYETIFLENEGRLDADGVFEGVRLIVDATAGRGLIATKFEVVAQLRPTNANRVLQLTGQHFSRIGMDFVGTAAPQD
jgi:hypothetical protein